MCRRWAVGFIDGHYRMLGVVNGCRTCLAGVEPISLVSAVTLWHCFVVCYSGLAFGTGLVSEMERIRE